MRLGGEALIWELMDFGGYELGECWEERMQGGCRTCFHSSNVVKLEWKVYYMGCLEFSLLVKSIFMCVQTQLNYPSGNWLQLLTSQGLQTIKF